MADGDKLFRQELSSLEQWRLVHLRDWLARNPMRPGEPSRTSRRGPSSSTSSPDDSDISNISFRIAPSIIVRSEAELLGINSPRFALRACLRNEAGTHLGFINLRRLKTFQKAVSKRLSLHNGHQLLESLGRVGCLADGFLNPVIAYPNYVTITTSLAPQYGEEGPERGVPFVTHFPIGGGLCAQAICFQASLLRYRDARSVFGVSEITLLATDPKSSGSTERVSAESTYLNFSGLRPSQIATFFNHREVGLGTTVGRLYYPRPNKTAINSAADPGTERSSRWKSALLAYLRSGIPVILPVDGHRMAPAFGSDFPHSLLPRYASPRNAMHCVLAVGFDQSGTRVLINDPSTFPLLDCDLDNLLAMAPQPVGEPRHWMIPVHNAPGYRPLLDYDDKGTTGLFESVSIYSRRSGKLGATDWNTSRWFLMQEGTDLADDLGRRLSGPYHEELPSAQLRQQAAQWLQQNHEAVGTQRAWLEILPNRGGRLWDACEQNTDSKSARKQGYPWLVDFPNVGNLYTLPAADEPADTVATDTLKTVSKQSVPLSDGSTPLPVRPAIISSFSTDGIALSCQRLDRKGHRELIELYAFMQPDSDRLLKKQIGYTGKNSLDAVEMMGSFASEVAVSRIVSKLQKLKHQAFYRIAALATFIPEIADPPDSQRGQLASSALQFVARLALEIRKQQLVAPEIQRQTLPGLKAIEVVAGSRITSVYSAILPDASYPQLIAQTASDAEAARNTVSNLVTALSTDHRRQSDVKSPLSLGQALHAAGMSVCLELEPGPLYALRNLKTLETFCQELDRRANAIPGSFPIGFNLDIAHWRMAGLKPHMIPHEVKQRIGHSHIAGHDIRGHLGDTVLREHDHETFRPWLEFLQGLQKESGRIVPYSGILSVEFEAARNLEEVFSTLKTVSRWLH